MLSHYFSNRVGHIFIRQRGGCMIKIFHYITLVQLVCIRSEFKKRPKRKNAKTGLPERFPI
ncbi:hypothetical protein D3C76_649210 [compost metagenome]